MFTHLIGRGKEHSLLDFPMSSGLWKDLNLKRYCEARFGILQAACDYSE